jgi:type II secretory pathway pseudopilin PulG
MNEERSRTGQEGFLMVALVAAIAVMLIFTLLALQSWDDVIRRDNEAEMIFRAQDLARAIQRFRLDQGRSPLELKELLEPGTRNQYFLRQLWTDPLVKDGKWGLLLEGPGGVIIDPNAEDSANGLPGQPSSGGLGQSRPGVLGQNRNKGSKAKRSKGPASLLNPEGSGQVGLPIVGVRTLSDDKPFRLWRDLENYDEWKFTYLDFSPRQTGAPPGQQPPGGQQGQQGQQGQSGQQAPRR